MTIKTEIWTVKLSQTKCIHSYKNVHTHACERDRETERENVCICVEMYTERGRDIFYKLQESIKKIKIYRKISKYI